MLKAVRAFFYEFEWIHLTLAMIGNTTFLIGSVLFFWESTKTAGVWLFVVGAAGMLIGSIGSALVRWRDREHGSRQGWVRAPWRADRSRRDGAARAEAA